MRILVMGAGAIGSLFGALLGNAGYHVILVGRKPHVDAINSNGLIISGITQLRVKLQALTHPVPADLVLLTVKSYDTSAAASQLELAEDAIVLSLQNGLGNYEKLAEILGPERVILGITSQAARFLEPGLIEHTGTGISLIGEPSGKLSPRLIQIQRIFERAGIETQITDQIFREIWRKLIANAGINPITALARVRNGELLRDRELNWIMRAAVEEAVDVANKLGMGFDRAQILEYVEGIIARTAANESSMLQDVKRGKRTEIDAITGAILKLGKELGLELPINRVLYSLMKSLESNLTAGHG